MLVFGNLKRPSGENLQYCSLIFIPKTLVRKVSTGISTKEASSVSLTNELGNFGISLCGGIYDVQINGKDWLTINVPDQEVGEINIFNIIEESQ